MPTRAPSRAAFEPAESLQLRQSEVGEHEHEEEEDRCNDGELEDRRASLASGTSGAWRAHHWTTTSTSALMVGLPKIAPAKGEIGSNGVLTATVIVSPGLIVKLDGVLHPE